MKPVLIIDDEREICNSISMILEYEGYTVDSTTSASEGLKKFSELDFSAVLLDIQMPEMNGFEVLKKIKELNPSASVIIISAHGSVENAIKATRLGAFDFLEKPIDRDKLLISVRNATEQASLKEENEEIKKTFVGEGEILGKSKAIQKILELIDKVAPLETRVLITGENGTGKELVARAIHKKSERKDKPFIEVNCAAIPNELIESELFGHEKGSFTGAVSQRIGKFELANKGIIFLDEIGDMSLQAQAKVLRAIEEGRIERVGGGKKIEVDVRIIAATNKNLLEEIHKGNFREDLYHRLNVIPIHVPPLRERVEDIPILVEHFCKEITAKHKKPSVRFTDDAIKILQAQPWTGNVRELRNIVERIIIIVDKREITAKDIDFLFAGSQASLDNLIETSNSFQEFKEKAERAFILKQLKANDWNISKTAEILDIQRSHLYTKMRKYGIEKEEE
ncbi:NtrC family response regulator [Ignavibacterium album JCM 16511]|uniref:NtrC family response regulator n=1 Tax=Ignavibacterium album (strain DSM 19864 / JCM 16511 / NBRC 101810 / Mat9-16) TaxID=945713 RepID=I0AL60_IGNAJ|nr:sigma-54 dependent transcriptional regulator [Ignavibacterium album]AFH49717.1 NtrC family response regulator [Ignavibacterium album JCM 16511]